jgi:protein gp37
MAENSAIEWTQHTFNPWWGCTKVSPGCDHCYAEVLDKRTGGAHWGPHAERRRTKDWSGPIKWNRRCEKLGIRERVFCASMADVFDNAVPVEWRSDLFDLIRQTPHLDWLLLTKRPQNIAKMLPPDWGNGWPNVWLGTTVENQAEAERRILHLLSIPARVRFLSCEPMLGPISFRWAKWDTWRDETGNPRPVVDEYDGFRMLDWVICGGETGPGARPMHPDWARDLRDQCRSSGVSFFMKQMWGQTKRSMPVIPDDLLIREFPNA